MRINLHIERLVLDGVPLETADRARLQSAVQTELARLLTAEHLRSGGNNWGAGGAVPSLRSADINFSAQDNPAHLGSRIAGSIFSGVTKER